MVKRIIIIGASSGIGKEMAKLYIERGYKVGITGRRNNLLSDIKRENPSQVVTRCFDVTADDNVANIESLIAELGGLDLFIYNAGFGDANKQLNQLAEKQTTLTNVLGFVESVSYIFNYFLLQGSGHIALTSSIAAFRGNSWSPAYSASKAFMSNYAEGLNIKARKLGTNIIVTDIKPGFIDTKMSKGNGRFWMAPPMKAAIQIMEAIDRKKRIVYITRRWWLIAQLLKILPYSLYRRLA